MKSSHFIHLPPIIFCLHVCICPHNSLALPTYESQNTLVTAYTSTTAAIQFIHVNNVISSKSLLKPSSLLSIKASEVEVIQRAAMW